MNIVRSLAPSKDLEGIEYIALGFFDGLHRGHAEVILKCAPQIANEKRAVLTFDKHPAAILQPQQKPCLITGLEHKLYILRQWGIGATIILDFDQKRVHESAEDFLKELEKAFPHLRGVGVGPDWRFGFQRKGDIELLKKWGETCGLEISVAPVIEEEGERIGSRRVRKAIEKGNIEKVAQMLGREFSLYGQVVKGEGRGMKLGFPTINVHTQDECFPPLGVYAGEVVLESGLRWMSVMNLGYRPTLNNEKQEIGLEAHLLGFSNEIYTDWVEVIPKTYLRAQKKFASLRELGEAIKKDIELCRALHRLQKNELLTVSQKNKNREI